MLRRLNGDISLGPTRLERLSLGFADQEIFT
jgi:hypothetical protein